MPELLLEIRSEEIPARMQARAAADLKRLVSEGLTKAGLEFESAESYVTPRRLALVVQGLPLHSESKVEEKKGPKVGAPEQAIQGFMKANGLSDISEAELRDTDKGQFYFLVREVAGRATRDVIAEILRDVIFGFPWPKSMRWGEGDIRWVRPIQGLLVLFDGTEIVHDFGSSIRSGTSTLGHRFLAPEPFEVTDFADYKEKLRAAKVMLDPAERRATIAAQADEVSRAAGLTLLEDPALLDEVAGLVEWPRVLLGRIDRDFMELPPEVLTVSMRAHQKYFALNDSEGRFAANFLVVANMDGSDELHRTIVAGNERVLRARLADAQFFWDQDRKATLQSRVGALKEMVFHEKLGSLEDKVDRVTALAVEIARHIDGAETDRVRSAARLCKADLTTGMVGEFPELQGVMGRYYALKDGEHYEVASAIAEHYAPLGPKDRCPAAPVSVAVALADKIDTLVGFWAIDEK
ncbi:MAG: glycine--tRNA ligase subunit beta, partial [Rhodovibrionaceae bacterium]